MTELEALIGNEGVVAVDTELERTTELYMGEDGLLRESTSSTPGVTITRVYVNGKQLDDVPEPLFEAVMDALYDAGYTS